MYLIEHTHILGTIYADRHRRARFVAARPTHRRGRTVGRRDPHISEFKTSFAP